MYWEILPGLYQSTSLHTEKDIPEGVDIIVRTAFDAPTLIPLTSGLFINIPLHDNMNPPFSGFEEIAVRQITKLVAAAVKEGKKVLVHCAAGLNISGVFIARALMYGGMNAQNAIDFLREKRGTDNPTPKDVGEPALNNKHYVEWLLNECPS